MASELPTSVLGNLASSVKSIVTGHSADAQTTHTKIEETTVKAHAVKKVDKDDQDVEMHGDSTTVHKEEAAAVVHEDVKRHELEKVDTVVDREVHQDHYHTTILPVKDTKVLAAKHVYQEHEDERAIDHRDNKAKKKLKQEAATIHNERKVEETTHSQEVAPTKQTEHIHHHIHETIQPVIEREVIQEKIIHTTNHVHETEHLKDEFHGATVAPAISMADFQAGMEAQIEASVAKAVAKEEKPKTRSTSITREEKPKTRSTSVTKEISVSDLKKGGAGTTVESKKRDAPTEDVDVEADSKVVKKKRGSSCTVISY